MTALTTDQALPDERDRQCHAALFLTYSFDPEFFEHSILPSFIPVAADPVGEPARFLSESTSALRRMPVVVVADATKAKPNRRLPYDLLLVARRTFHPKLTVLVFDDAISLRIASGNLTRSGYGDQAELFLEMDLHPQDPTHMAALLDLQTLLDVVAQDLPTLTPQWHEVRDAITAQIEHVHSEVGVPTVRLLHPEGERSLLERVWETLPSGAYIDRIGVLAPFFEVDCATDAAQIDGFLAALVALSSASTTFDIVCPWERQEPLTAHPPTIADHTPGWWEETCEEEAGSNWTYFATTTEATKARYVVTRDRNGDRTPYPIEDMQAWHDEHTIRALPPPQVFVPQHALTSLAAHHDVALWLHPALRVVGRTVHRQPMHAKALTVTYRHRGHRSTMIVVGSANASRKAWTQTLSKGANCELMAVIHQDGDMPIQDLDPWIVHCPRTLIAARERDYPQGVFDPASYLAYAIYDPNDDRLTVAWADVTPKESWSLLYDGTVVLTGPPMPSGTMRAEGVVFRPGVFVLVIDVHGVRGEVPIQITAPVYLPMPGPVAGYALEDLIRLMGHAVGRSALEARYAEIGSESVSGTAIDNGGTLRPTDVFKAWWALAADLAVPGITPRATAVLIDGPTGAKRTWHALLERAMSGAMDAYEAWFFGAELTRELEAINLQGAVRAQERRAAIEAFVAEIRHDMTTLPIAMEHPWATALQAFYRPGAPS